jgi:thymidylate synthase
MSDDREYRKWLKAFYEGSFLVKGWTARKKELLASMEGQGEAEKILDELGKLIGDEWAKDNRIRKIDTDDVKRWGEQLQETKGKPDKKIITELKKIKKEVTKTLKA